jgi:hypothetical protein
MSGRGKPQITDRRAHCLAGQHEVKQQPQSPDAVLRQALSGTDRYDKLPLYTELLGALKQSNLRLKATRLLYDTSTLAIYFEAARTSMLTQKIQE